MDESKREPEDWEINIRSDMWTTMNISQLIVQQELVLNNLGLLSTLQASNPTVLNLHCALKMALEDLNLLINKNEDMQKTKKRIMM